MTAGGAEAALLQRIEAYFDAVPRPAADVEEHGPLTLFVSRIPWRFYGRPRLGLDGVLTAGDVRALRARQRALGVREALEWVDETTPSLAGAAEAAGMRVARVPLLALDVAAWRPVPIPAGVGVRGLDADDDALRASQGAVEVAFAHGDMATGPAGAAARDAAAAAAGGLGFLRDRIRAGITRVAVAETASEGVVAAGSHQPRDGVSELMGIGTLPAARRRGIGLALTGGLVEDARAIGVQLAVLSAASDDVARLYARAGFRRVATACFGRPA